MFCTWQVSEAPRLSGLARQSGTMLNVQAGSDRTGSRMFRIDWRTSAFATTRSTEVSVKKRMPSFRLR